MGSPEFAVPALEALLTAGHEIVMVYAPPARPAGRDARPALSPVASLAARRGLPQCAPARLRGNAEEWARFAALELDAAVVAAYGLILPREMLGAPRRGCLNIHASLLPRWRGAAPVAAAILAGDRVTGVSIMQMDAGLDTGPVLLEEAVPIPADATAGTLTRSLGLIGAGLIVRALEENPPPRPQAAEGATYAPRLSRADGRLNWNESAEALARRVRAFDPWPGTFCLLGPVRLKVLTALAVPGAGAPGTIVDSALTVGCGAGALRLLSVQPAGGKPMDGASFVRGHRLQPGALLG